MGFKGWEGVCPLVTKLNTFLSEPILSSFEEMMITIKLVIIENPLHSYLFIINCLLHKSKTLDSS